VVDDEGRIKAVFTQGDFVSYTWPNLIYQMRSIATATVTVTKKLAILSDRWRNRVIFTGYGCRDEHAELTFG
jgi:hypothetical protein